MVSQSLRRHSLLAAFVVLAAISSVVKCADEDEIAPPEAFGNDLGTSLQEMMEELEEADLEKEMSSVISDREEYKDMLDKLTEILGDSGHRLLVTVPDGEVVFDTAKGEDNKLKKFKNGKINENHNDRQAIIDALADGVGYETKFSKTTGQDEMYIAKVLGEKDDPVGVMRVSGAAPHDDHDDEAEDDD